MSAEYGADQIQILEGLEAVRKKPVSDVVIHIPMRNWHRFWHSIPQMIIKRSADWCRIFCIMREQDIRLVCIPRIRKW